MLQGDLKLEVENNNRKRKKENKIEKQKGQS